MHGLEYHAHKRRKRDGKRTREIGIQHGPSRACRRARGRDCHASAVVHAERLHLAPEQQCGADPGQAGRQPRRLYLRPADRGAGSFRSGQRGKPCGGAACSGGRNRGFAHLVERGKRAAVRRGQRPDGAHAARKERDGCVYRAAYGRAQPHGGRLAALSLPARPRPVRAGLRHERRPAARAHAGGGHAQNEHFDERKLGAGHSGHRRRAGRLFPLAV